jgi:hypothetical protein
LSRLSVCQYGETLGSWLHVGNAHTSKVFQPMVEAAETLLKLSPRQRGLTRWRLDGGFGTDANINWLLARDYQAVLKGYNATRATAAGRQTAAHAWQAIRFDRWVAPVADGHRYARRTQSLVVRWLDKKQLPRHALLIHTLLNWSALAVVKHYDARGGQEVEIKQDKFGLKLTHRRKRHWEAQEAWVILTDLAHNLLRWSYPWMWAGSQFEDFGFMRLIQDVLKLPGTLAFKGDKLTKVSLCETHPYALEVTTCLRRLLTELS